ncbi:two-component response regulator-like APRR3 isoform X2 [Hibiscus syriacus]|uniref:two-component response regulator-like APRR3 isoform X2 n=1 Tax=Hibiscus syriacus TaxID=106335 RepID=UPI001920A655|nr:two-component response regulator-like APRR3 isoform X2 [Hibiscus syriacus]
MGEATMEVDVEVGAAEARNNDDNKKKNEENDGSSEVVRWEKFLPRTVLRVLLVEADDSTRQIIAALLRKCSYRVAAVPDGLMAWEILKDRPHNIDLILTEVELPSISGFALLTLIMEHDICKNIPVIMMSSQDSITTVLKCMLKGAADFLIKPVRRNELRNLWQHVWRRHMLANGGVPLKLTAMENEVETNAESESSQFSDYGSSTQKNKEESDSKGFSEGKCTSANLSDMGRDQHGNVVKMGQESIRNGGQIEGISDKTFILENSNRLVKVKEVAHCSEACEPDASKLEQNFALMKGTTHGGRVGQQSNQGNANASSRVGCNDELFKPPTGAIDLIGSFDNRPKGTCALSSTSDGTDKFELSHELELSLRRSCSNSSKNQGTSERPMLNHSNASAFSWYNNSNSSQAVFSTPVGNQDALKENDSKSKLDLESNNDTCKPHVVPLSDSMENLTNPVACQSEPIVPSTQLGLIHVPGVRMDDMHPGCNNVFPHVYHAQSNPPLDSSSEPAGRQEQSPIHVSTSAHTNPDVHDPEQGYNLSDEGTNCSIDQTVKEETKQELAGLLRCISPIANQSACSSLCDGLDNHEKGSAHGDISSRSSASTTGAAAIDRGTTIRSFNDSNSFIQEGLKGMDSHRSSQREAALTKFRLKRKDRCFEKKVRYQSRKRLAEQRPRVRGQFVRQVQNDTPVHDVDAPNL